MTVVVAIKIAEGVAVASDSASSLLVNNSVVNIYNNANKIFNLRKGWPIGAMTSGAGSIGRLPISTIVKDFRIRLAAKNEYDMTLLECAQQFFNFLREEHYDIHHEAGGVNNPQLNFYVFGFSPNDDLPEIFSFSLGAVHVSPREAIPKEGGGACWSGEPELVQRIMSGYGIALPLKLQELGIEKDKIDQALNAQRQSVGVVCEAMPIQDAIDLAEFLVKSTVEFSRFRMGAPTVGGPVEVASISKHEGFKWISRKYYFSRELNP